VHYILAGKLKGTHYLEDLGIDGKVIAFEFCLKKQPVRIHTPGALFWNIT